MIQQFAYIHGVAGISLLLEKKYKVRQYSFSLSKTTSRNPNHQNKGFYILCTGFTMGYKKGQKIFLHSMD